MGVWKMAWRNVWRSKRRSIVTMAAMTLALLVLVLYSGLVTGYLQGMERRIVDLEMGDIQIHAAGYLDRPSKYTLIEDPDALLGALDAAGLPAAAHLLAGALAGGEQSSAGVALRGVDVAREDRVSRMHSAVADGHWLDPADPHGVVIGRRLARALSARTGSELVILTQAMDGAMANDLFTVRGILEGVSDATDRTAVFMNAAAFRELLGLEHGAQEIVVRRPAELPLQVAAQRVASLASGLDVRTWKQLVPVVANMLDSTQGLMLVVFAIVYIGVGILILNAMLMAVFERIRELGILKAVGGGPGRVLGMILAESLIQIALATVVGLALAVPCMTYLATHGLVIGAMSGVTVAGLAAEPIWYGVYSSQTVVVPVVMLFVIALLSVLYPAVKAARIRPVVAMHYQ